MIGARLFGVVKLVEWVVGRSLVFIEEVLDE